MLWIRPCGDYFDTMVHLQCGALDSALRTESNCSNSRAPKSSDSSLPVLSSFSFFDAGVRSKLFLEYFEGSIKTEAACFNRRNQNPN